MPLCHQCSWNDRPPSDAKRAACLACPGPGDWLTHKGAVHVSIDAGGAQTAGEVEASLQRRAEEDGGDTAIDVDDPDTRAAMELGAMRVLLYFKALTKEEVVSLWLVLHYASLADAAEDLHRTRAMVSHLWREVVARRPELSLVLTGRDMAGGRAVDGQRRSEPRLAAPSPDLVQGELFD